MNQGRALAIRLLSLSASSVVALALPAIAHAQVAIEPELQAGATVGVTTNVGNTPVPPEDAPANAPRPEWDGYGQLSPGVRLTFETPRTSHALNYLFNYRFYFTHPEANAIQNTVAYTFGAETSATSALTLGLTGVQTQVSVFDVTGGAVATPLPGGDNLLYIATASEAVSVDLSEVDSFSQGLTLSATNSVGEEIQTQTYLASVTFNYDHQFENDVVGGTLGTDALYFPEQELIDGTRQDTHVDMIHRGAVRWHHDFSDYWSTDLAAGAMVGYLANDPSNIEVQPEGSAAVNFVYGLFTFGALYAHAGQPNLILQQTVLTDTVTLRTGAPFGRSGFDITLATSGNASRGLLDQGFSPVTYSVLADAALGYQPDPLPLRFSLHYQFFRQLSFNDPPDGVAGVPDIRRQNLELSITLYYPEAPGTGQPTGIVPVIPAPTSNPDILGQRRDTRGGAADGEREERDEEREKREERDRRRAPGD